MTETILVIGAGAISGVGGAIARLFASRDYHVIVAAEHTQSLTNSLSVFRGGWLCRGSGH